MFGFGKSKNDDLAPQQEQRSLADPADWLLDIFGAAPALSGLTVSPTTAMKCAAVRSAVEAICEAVGGLPLHVFVKAADGARERATEHPAYGLLRDQANDWTPAPAFIEMLTQLVMAIETETAAMEQLEQASESAKGMAKDFLGGIVDDLRNGVDGATALANAFGRLADQLLDMALDSLVDGLFSGFGGGGGLFAGLFGMAGGGAVEAATGGHIRGPGTSTSDSIPAMLSDGEFVVKAAQARKHGALLEAINSGRVQAFADGGKVGSGGLAGIVSRAPSINIGDINVTTEGSSGDRQSDEDSAKMTAKAIDQMLEKKMAKWATNQARAGGILSGVRS